MMIPSRPNDLPLYKLHNVIATPIVTAPLIGYFAQIAVILPQLLGYTLNHWDIRLMRISLLGYITEIWDTLWTFFHPMETLHPRLPDDTLIR